MKKIMSEEEKEKRERKKQVLVGTILILIMVLSVIEYSFLNPGSTKKVKYNNVEFSFVNGLWYFKINNDVFSVSYLPQEVLNISIDISKNLDQYYNKPLYFYYQNEKEAESEIARNMEKYVKRINYACFLGDNCDWSEKNCSENMIIIKEINNSMIKEEENCVYIFYKEGENLKAADAFLYKILGII